MSPINAHHENVSAPEGNSVCEFDMKSRREISLATHLKLLSSRTRWTERITRVPAEWGNISYRKSSVSFSISFFRGFTHLCALSVLFEGFCSHHSTRLHKSSSVFRSFVRSFFLVYLSSLRRHQPIDAWSLCTYLNTSTLYCKIHTGLVSLSSIYIKKYISIACSVLNAPAI